MSTDAARYMREYRKRFKDKVNRDRRLYRFKHLEDMREYEKIQARKHRKDNILYDRKYRKKNLEKLQATDRLTYNRNSEVLKYYAKKHSRTTLGRYTYSKSQARAYGRVWQIPFKRYTELIIQPCTYCHGPLNPTSIGLDRINNDLGYSLDNVLPCCKTCNIIRGRNLTVEEMHVAINAVLEYRKLKKFVA